MAICPVCLGPCERAGLLCVRCGPSLDRIKHGDSTLYAAICWAARRARHFERKRMANPLPKEKK